MGLKGVLGSTWVRRCGKQTAGVRGGQKCSVITQSTAHSDPLPGLTETGQTPTTHPAILPAPEGSSRQLRNFRIGIRQGLQLGGEFLPSFVWTSYCLALASRCSLSGSVVPPAPCFDIVLAQGQGSGGQRHVSLTGNELQTVFIIKVKI